MAVFIIAEAGVNHNGCLSRAKELIDIAAESGADAVKFQTFKTEQLVTTTAAKADYQIHNTKDNDSQFNMLKKLELSVNDHAALIEYCEKYRIQFLSTPFDLQSLHLLTQHFALPMLKIASGEITNAPLLLAAAQSGKPIILSTGMATLGDIEYALSILACGYMHPTLHTPSSYQLIDAYRSHDGQNILKRNVTLLHCTTEYPAPMTDVNLRVLDTLKQAFHLRVGYSDHTPGIEVAIAAAALGAQVIEKHFTTDKNLPGPDHQASLEPHELANMITAIRHIEKALGNGSKIPSGSEFKNRAIARKSLVALSAIKKGDEFNVSNLGLKRPGDGISGIYYWEWLGKIAQQDYQENDLIEAV
jgi:N-acetylneuraminate synthase